MTNFEKACRAIETVVYRAIVGIGKQGEGDSRDHKIAHLPNLMEAGDRRTPMQKLVGFIQGHQPLSQLLQSYGIPLIVELGESRIAPTGENTSS